MMLLVMLMMMSFAPAMTAPAEIENYIIANVLEPRAGLVSIVYNRKVFQSLSVCVCVCV